MNNEINQVLIDHFEIPEDLARELSELLTKQTIYDRLIMQLMNDQDKFNQAVKDLTPITAKIEAIKIRITREFVPAKYNDRKFMWNYDGYEVDGNKIQVLENQ